MYKNGGIIVSNKKLSLIINYDSFREYLDLDDKKVGNEISVIFGYLQYDLLDKRVGGVVEYDGVNLVLITDSETLNEFEKRDYFFRRNLSYIIKKYSKMLLPYNKNYNEQEGI